MNNVDQRKLLLFKKSIEAALKITEEKLKEGKYPGMYKDCKEFLDEIKLVAEGKKEVDRPQTQSTSLGLMASRVVFDIYSFHFKMRTHKNLKFENYL